MRQLFVFPLAVALFSFSSCNHDDDGQPPRVPSTDSPVSTFGISGDTVVAVVRARTTTASISLLDSGSGQEVHLSISGLPPGVTAEVNPPTGTPTFSTTVRFNASVYAVAGSSSIATILATQADGTEKRHSVKVTVLDNPVCTEIRAGQYTGYGCGSGGYTTTVTPDSALPNTRIRMSRFLGLSYTAYADLNCSDSSIVFPPQNFYGSSTISGSGRYTRDSILVSAVTVTPGFGSSHCNLWFFRQ